jgi:hypothetical protein
MEKQMQRRAYAAAVMGISLVISTPGFAQQVEWKQTVNTPKGQNMPQGVTADILGIEAGESYAEARAKLQKLADEGYKAPKRDMSDSQRAAAEVMGAHNPYPVLQESTMMFNLRQPGAGGLMLQGSYVGQIMLRRELPGSTKQNLTEVITVKFSAPSSGQQVLGIQRQISYPMPGDQPKITVILASLKAKFKTEFYQASAINNIYRAQFDDGRSIVPKGDLSMACQPQYDARDQGSAQRINQSGQCDVLMQVAFNKGISAEHASSVIFILSDNERTKADLAADFAYLDAYVKKLQSGAAAAPKL